MNGIDEPLNPTERYLYGINMRLEVLITVLSSLVDAYGKQNAIAVTSEIVKEEIPLRKSRKKRGD